MTDEQLKELRRMTDGTPLKVELDPAILLALLDMVEERGHTQGGWISVEERLPEDGVKVLLWRRQADSWDNDKHIYYGDYREGRGLRHDGAGGRGWHAEYSHWQPLLAAPPETKTAGELRGDQ